MKYAHPLLAPALGLGLALGLAAQPVTAAASRTAVFAGGCFWSMEHDMEKIAGVLDVVSGYAGGTRANPTYENHADHLEAVRVTYDPARISYAQLAARYLRVTDPTDGQGAFCDRGHAYQPAIFAGDSAERQAALAAIASARTQVKGKIVTPVRGPTRFWNAEGYHQDYAKKNPVRYRMYRAGCGKDRRIAAVWK